MKILNDLLAWILREFLVGCFLKEKDHFKWERLVEYLRSWVISSIYTIYYVFLSVFHMFYLYFTVFWYDFMFPANKECQESKWNEKRTEKCKKRSPPVHKTHGQRGWTVSPDMGPVRINTSVWKRQGHHELTVLP